MLSPSDVLSVGGEGAPTARGEIPGSERRGEGPHGETSG